MAKQNKTALIFGISGQAGSYLADFLSRKGYNIVGTHWRGDPGPYTSQKADLSSQGWATYVIREVMPDEVYNMASLMFAPASWNHPYEYMQVNAMSVVEMLDTIHRWCPLAKFFQAGSAEVFERGYPTQMETTPRKAKNPYAASKMLAETIVKVYREQKGLFACTGTFFNMESPRRPNTFFAEKVASEAVRVLRQYQRGEKVEPIQFGNLSAVRDWGLTAEYVVAAWSMLNAEVPKDYVIGTGEAHSCLEFVEEALRCVGLTSNKSELFSYDPTVVEGDMMCALPSQIFLDLKWRARTKFDGVVKHLVDAELRKVKRG